MSIQIKVSERSYIKDPDTTDLGRRIVEHSILLIDEIGFEQFTFRKLSEKIGSTEASIYRYFENKHKLLIYLVSWYWNWLEYQLSFRVQNIEDPQKRLYLALETICEPVQSDPTFSHVNEEALYRIVVSESAKAYLTKEVDADNKEGYFRSFKRLCNQIATIVQEINPAYPYPHSLISTVMEAAQQQKFFSEHLPSLTEIKKSNQKEVIKFVTGLVRQTINNT